LPAGAGAGNDVFEVYQVMRELKFTNGRFIIFKDLDARCLYIVDGITRLSHCDGRWNPYQARHDVQLQYRD
jgi:hypothetical protein